MQVTAINKIISMLLVGTLAVILILLLWPIDNLKSVYESSGIADITSQQALFTTAASVALTIFLGALIDGLANLVVRPVVYLIARSKSDWLTTIFRCSYNREIDTLTKEFLMLCEKNPSMKPLKETLATRPHSIAATILFSKAPQHHFAWFSSHYATYFLYSAYFVALILFTFFAFPMGKIDCYGLLVMIFVLYIIFVRAIDLHAYSYCVILRHACHTISSSQDEKSIA